MVYHVFVIFPIMTLILKYAMIEKKFHYSMNRWHFNNEMNFELKKKFLYLNFLTSS